MKKQIKLSETLIRYLVKPITLNLEKDEKEDISIVKFNITENILLSVIYVAKIVKSKIEAIDIADLLIDEIKEDPDTKKTDIISYTDKKDIINIFKVFNVTKKTITKTLASEFKINEDKITFSNEFSEL